MNTYKPANNPWNLFDAVCLTGRHLKLQADGPHTVDDLLAAMDHFGIAEALVMDCVSRENHPAEGNPRILETLGGHDRLHPVWSALPHAPLDEQPCGEDFVAAMRKNSVGAAFFYPAQFGFNLADWSVDHFTEPLADAKVPIFINYNEVGPNPSNWDHTNWREMVEFCRRWPQLPVILSEWRIRRQNRTMYRALESCPNLRIELSGCWLNHCIEYITGSFGAQRLIFGTNWPMFGQSATVATLTCADIEDADKRLIAGDNLRELLSWNLQGYKAPQVELPEPADKYAAFARSGVRPPELSFMDNHGHMGGRSRDYHLPNCELDACIEEMDRLGIARTCIFAFTGINSDERVGNDNVAEAVRRYGDRFVGMTMLNPHRGEKWMLDELERCAAMGLMGIKLIAHYQGYPEEGPLIDLACQWANDRKQIILHHSWGSAAQMERLVSTYTEACFFTGHATNLYADVMKRHDNLYVCSCPLMSPDACENMVASIGADRLLFGSDMQDLPIPWGLGPILTARIDASDKEKILGKNLENILKHYSLTP